MKTTGKLDCALVRLLVVIALLAFAAGDASGEGANLLANGGFETDADGDGVADGWRARPFNFSRQTHAEVQAYIDQLPPAETLLEAETILAADGTPIWTRQADGKWEPNILTFGSQYWGEYEKSWKPEVNWYQRVKREAIPRYSRFGEWPVRADSILGDCTLVLTSRRPHEQVFSEPVAVKPGTGYRLTFQVRTSGGGEYWRGPQVLEGACDPETVPVSPNPGDHYNNGNVLNSLPASYWWGSGIAGQHWARMELPFRTGPNCSSIVIRLPYNHREEAQRREMNNEHYRIWYDDLRLVEDPSVLGIGPSHEGAAEAVEPQWPAAAVERGFAVTGRPTLPMTYGNYQPGPEEIDAPLRLTLAAGESDSVVIFVRNLRAEAIALQAGGGGKLDSDDGYGLYGAYGSSYVTIRAAEIETRFLTSKRFVYTPKYLLNTRDLSLRPHSSGQYWLTVAVPPGTPAGEYTAQITVARTNPAAGDDASGRVNVPLILTVRDLELESAKAAFFTWYHTAPVGDKQMGSPVVLPGAEEIYLADQRRHGMNTVALHCYAEGLSKDGQVRVSLNELDAMVERVRRSGLCRNHPLLLSAWSRPMEKRGTAVSGSSYTFCSFAGGRDTVMAIAEHAKTAAWPDFVFTVSDEPNSDHGAAVVAQVIGSQYAAARKAGVRTATAGGYPGAFTRPLNEKGDTLGDLYDVWIEGCYGDQWPETREAAKQKNAELWMYNCWLTGAGYLQERFYAGLWTWRTGARGNGVWSYGWYVRINDSGLPEAKVAWEGRAAGVNDYRYLQTLENTIGAGDASGKAAAAVRSAKNFLADLRGRIPLTTYRQRPGAIPQNQWAELDAWNPVPAIRPEDYGRIRDDCAAHILAIRRECGLVSEGI